MILVSRGDLGSAEPEQRAEHLDFVCICQTDPSTENSINSMRPVICRDYNKRSIRGLIRKVLKGLARSLAPYTALKGHIKPLRAFYCP